MVKSETYRDAETLGRKSETETSRLFAKAVEISRSHEKVYEIQEFRDTIRHLYYYIFIVGTVYSQKRL